MTGPAGYAQLLALGDPRKFVGRDGGIDEAAWQQHLGLVVVDFPSPLQLSFGSAGQTAHSVRCHPVAADAFRHAFAVLAAEGIWPDLHTFGGGYAFRMQRGTDAKISTHAWGLAADFDVLHNPLGGPSKMSLAAVQIFESCGFTWGGRWMRPDPMHVQLCSGY